MSITLLRHAAPVQEGLCYGQTDVPVVDVQDHVLEDLRARWQKDMCPQIWTSPALRCRSLAEQIVKSQNHIFRFDERLRELHFGAWENRLWAEIPRAELDAWGNDWQSASPPCGESFAQLHARVKGFLQELPCNQSVWIVAHAGVIRILYALLRARDPAEFISFPVPYLEPLVIP